jgi:hypothetical protein
MIQSTPVQKSNLEIVEFEPEGEEQEICLWTQSGVASESYVEEPVKVEQVKQTAMEIINEDIKRHRKSSASKQKPRLDQQSLDSALSSFLIGCNMTFDIIDSDHFKKFVHTLNPSCDLPTSSQLKTRILSQLSSFDTSERKSRKRRHYSSSESESD